MKILCHVGPWCTEYFRTLAAGFDADADVVFISGFKRLDETGTTASYYDRVCSALRRSSEDKLRDREVVQRCRLLRSLPEDEALAHVEATRSAVREALIRHVPDVLLSETCDQFLHDILFQEAEMRGIPAYGLVQTFVNGYFRASLRGERVPSRVVMDEECRTVLHQLLDRRYTPSMIARQRRSPSRAYARAWLSNIARVAWFSAMRRLRNEPYNYHYWASSRGIYRNHVHFLPSGRIVDENWETRLAEQGKQKIFVPLQFFPEATIDYWVEDAGYINYPDALANLLGRLSERFTIFVKEHPNVWGHRQPAFYKKLKKIADLVVVPSDEPAQRCLEECDATLVWTGSVGFEAALRGKPVLTISPTYYQSGSRFLRIELDTAADEIAAFIGKTEARPVSEVEQFELVRFLLEGLLPGRIQVDGSFNPANAEDAEAARAVGASLRSVYDGA